MSSPILSKKHLHKGSSSCHHSHTPVTALSLISENVVNSYEKKFAKQNIFKQFVVYRQTLSQMRIPEVVNLLRHQKLFPLLQFDILYNEEMVKLFYASLLGEFDGTTFAYSIQNKKITLGTNIWHEFGMYPQSPDAVQITDTSILPDFDYQNALNSMLRDPYPPRVVNSTLYARTVTTGALCPLDYILQWIVYRIIRPKKRGYSRAD